MTIFTTGYRCDAHGSLLRWLERNSGVSVIDVRFNPTPRDSRLSGERLRGTCPGRYQHLLSLTCAHVPSPGWPVRLDDPETGVLLARRIVARGDVLLLGGAEDPSSCHRREVAELLRTNLCPGARVVELTRDDLLGAPCLPGLE